jgi:hypothetical protein
VSTLLLATVYMFLHNLLNVLVQIANEMGLQKKNIFHGEILKFLWQLIFCCHLLYVVSLASSLISTENSIFLIAFIICTLIKRLESSV